MLAATTLAGCAPHDASNIAAENAQQPDPPTIVVPQSNGEVAALEAADGENPEIAANTGWENEPTSEFYNACVLAAFPTGGLVRVGDARAGDFVAVVSGSAEGSWEADGDASWIFRVEKTDKLTDVTQTIALEMRQTNTPPIENAGCGPRAVVVSAVARDGRRASAMEVYAAVRQTGRQAQRARDSGAFGATPYEEPISTANDGPYTEKIVSEQDAINRGVASEMGATR